MPLQMYQIFWDWWRACPPAPPPPGQATDLSGDRCVLFGIHLAEDDAKRVFRADAVLVAKHTAQTIGDDVISSYSTDEIVLL